LRWIALGHAIKQPAILPGHLYLQALVTLLLWEPLVYHPDIVVKKTETTQFSSGRTPWWRRVIVIVVLCCLVFSLATRTFSDTTLHSATVQSSSQQAMRQHMDRDAVRWAAPVANIAVSHVPTFYPSAAPDGPSLPTLLIAENVYNRPPPAR
jgi:hypothetical protein